MIPLVAIVRLRRPGKRGLTLWLPLFLIWLLLLPVIVLLLPIVILVLAAARARPFATLGALWGLMNALRGTRVEVDSRAQALFIHLC